VAAGAEGVTSTLAIAVSLVLATESQYGRHAHDSDHGRAVGIAQAWPVAVRECNRIAGTHYTLQDRRDPLKSVRMVELTLAYHLRHHPHLDAVHLAAKWRNPYSIAPAWHVARLKKCLHTNRNGRNVEDERRGL